MLSDRAGLPRVEVQLLRTGADPLRAYTDPTGAFEFDEVPAGALRLVARRIGYHPGEIAFAFAGRDTTVSITLVASTAILDTVTVSASGMPARYGPSSIMETFYARQQRGKGTFFTREAIEKSGHSSLQPLFASVTGVRVRTDRVGRIYLTSARCQGMGGQNAPGVLDEMLRSNKPLVGTFALFVDGMRTNDELIPETLKELSTADIEAMEVYKGPSELPMEALGDACSAIYIWTRRSRGSVLNEP